VGTQSKILIIDDQDFEYKLLQELVESLGCTSHNLNSESELESRIQNLSPDLILLDIGMRDISGEEVLQKIRNTYSSSVLPVIIISGKSKPEKIIEMLKAGANDYITKPFDFEMALARVNLHLKVLFQYRELIRLNEIETIRSMVTTYNHQINNPLAIASAGLAALKKAPNDIRRFDSIEQALGRIANITGDIRNLLDGAPINLEPYAGSETKIYKIK
jgi:DNA-binding response OmpR family regulator